MTMNNPTLSYPEAYAVVRWYCADFHENITEIIPEQFAADIEQLRRKISYYLEADVRWHDVEGVVLRLLEFAELESGDHEDLVQTANGAIDEGGKVRDRLNSQLRDDLYFTVTGAGIDPTVRLVAA